MKKPTIRRIIAYLIDIIIISLLATALSNVKAFNPKYDKYVESQEKLESIVEEAGNDVSKLNEILNSERMDDLSYDLAKNGIYVSIYSFIFTGLYFVGFAYITHGQTLGKKLLKIKIVSNNKDELTITQLLKRSLIINSLVTSLISIIVISALSKADYLNASRYISLIDTTLVLVAIGLVIYREDGRGLHDLFGETRVISIGDEEFFLKHEEVKEAQIVSEPVEEEKEVVTKPKRKTTKKKEDK